ncbi:unnamed protein product, partial [Meganyctiphanes norvegica]
CGDGSDEQRHLLPPVIINMNGSTIYWGQGGDATITCDLGCNSNQPTWYHNGSIIDFHSNTQVSVEHKNLAHIYRSVVRLSTVNIGSSGTYTCQPSANAQSAYQRLHITMGQQPLTHTHTFTHTHT